MRLKCLANNRLGLMKNLPSQKFGNPKIFGYPSEILPPDKFYLKNILATETKTFANQKKFGHVRVINKSRFLYL